MNRLVQTIYLLFAMVIGLPAFAQTKESVNKKDTVIYLPYKAGKARFSYNGKMGVIDSNGTIVLQAVLTSTIYPFFKEDRSYYFIHAGKRVGVIDTNYNIIVRPIYDDVDFLRGNHYCVTLNNVCTFVNSRGKVMTTWFEHGFSFSADGKSAPVKSGGLWGFLDSTGQFIIPPRYEWAFGFNEYNRAPVKVNGKWGFIDPAGTMKIEPLYDDGWGAFTNGLCPVKKNKKWGYIDTTGQVVIPFIYDDAEPFHCELTAVKKDGRYGFINQKNETVIPFRYRKAFTFGEKATRTQVKTGLFRWDLINKQGECLGCR